MKGKKEISWKRIKRVTTLKEKLREKEVLTWEGTGRRMGELLTRQE